MTENVEIEYKNIISSVEYFQLFEALHFESSQTLKQENIYFDTVDGKLKQHHIGLRVRITDHYVHLTMKRPIVDHQKLETTEKLSQDEGQEIKLTGQITRAGAVGEFLKSIDIELADLIIIGQFQTIRHQIKKDGHTLVLDHCYFSHFEDYELEIETDNPDEGFQFFSDILQKFQIPRRPVKQKIVRMSQLAADSLN